MKDIQEKISNKCDQIKEMLLSKNKAYGNSAIEPRRIFSKADAKEQLKVRIDDKISRIMNQDKDDEDAIKDLTGYLILLMILKEEDV